MFELLLKANDNEYKMFIILKNTYLDELSLLLKNQTYLNYFQII